MPTTCCVGCWDAESLRSACLLDSQRLARTPCCCCCCWCPRIEDEVANSNPDADRETVEEHQLNEPQSRSTGRQAHVDRSGSEKSFRGHSHGNNGRNGLKSGCSGYSSSDAGNLGGIHGAAAGNAAVVANKQRRGRYRTAAVLATEGGDAADIYKKPRPSVTSRRVLLQRQQQQHASRPASGARRARDARSLGAPEEGDANAETGAYLVVTGRDSTTSGHKGADRGEHDGTFEARLPATESGGSARALASSLTQSAAVGGKRSSEAVQHTGPRGRSCQFSEAPSRDSPGSSTDGRSHTVPAVMGSEGAVEMGTVQQLGHYQLKGNASGGYAAGGSSRAEKNCVGTGASGPPLSMRTTRHNKTKQPGVFQFTRGIKRFWAASWYADGHPGWKAFSVEKWGNTEALKRARKAYEEKVPHGSAASRASGSGGEIPGIQGGGEPMSQRAGQDSGDRIVSDGSQHRRERLMKAVTQQQDREVSDQHAAAHSLAEASNSEKKHQAEQDHLTPPFPPASAIAPLAGIGDGVAFSSSDGVFVGESSDRHAECSSTACQVRGKDFLEALWDEYDENNVGRGVISLEGTAGSGVTSLSCDTSSSSSFFLRSYSYSPRADRSCSPGLFPDLQAEQQKQTARTLLQGISFDAVGMNRRQSHQGLFGEDYSLRSPSHFLSGPENDDITGQLLLAGPAENAP
ncbi:ap2 domain transcription factor ap2x-10 [Cystoisospora suis]|uniref:Ap2 domain transcription factor ap2x-10 n=1 Tax=Cystoisospora suis TaxID=483139 RepID=A0A2C6KF85_9APIC|nr:ap2 domain transcription factor ap2x-10 [Cystoisospora suis]